MKQYKEIVVGPFLAGLADIVGLSFWALRFISLSCFSCCGSMPGLLRCVADKCTYCSQRRDFITSASARLTSAWYVWNLTVRGDIITRASWLSEECCTVTLRPRNVGVRRTAVLLLQLNSRPTDEEVLQFWRGELSATELTLSRGIVLLSFSHLL